MSYKPRSLFSLIEQIQNQDLFLPHIQRPFVWDDEQMRRLFDSLMRAYPIQTFLFWRTKAAIKARRFMEVVDWDADLHTLYHEAKSRDGVLKTFVLDGQQRLQTLFALFNGGVQPSASGAPVREAWFDVTSGLPTPDSDLSFRLSFGPTNPAKEDNLAAMMKRLFGTDPETPAEGYYRVRDLIGVDALKNAEELADELNEKLDAVLTKENSKERSDRQRRVRRNLGQLVSLLREEKHFWIQELDGVANNYSYSTILDIFVRVNSGGTKLEPADLMFAAMKAEWEPVEQEIEEVVGLLNGGRLEFDKNVVLKALVVAHGAGAVVTPEKLTSSKPLPSGRPLVEQIEADWETADAAFQQLRDFIENDLKLFHKKVVRSYASFIPLFDYLFRHPHPTPENRLRMKSFFYCAQLFNWFSASTDSRLDKLHDIIATSAGSDFPLATIKNTMSSAYGVSASIGADHILSSRVRGLILNLVYVETNSASPFNVAYKENEPHIDHIYPRSQLAKLKNGNEAPLLNSAEINHIGNFRYVGASDNKRKRAELPDKYFTRLKTGGVDVLRHLLVANFAQAPETLTFDAPAYATFRDARAAEILRIAERVVNI